MQNKNMNLPVWMFLKIVPAAFFFMYYWMCTRNNFEPYFRIIQSVIFYTTGLLVGFQLAYAKKKEIFDEFAKTNLKTTDSICLKVAFVLMIITVVVCIFPNISGQIAGYFTVISILFLTILRAAIFYSIDRKGI